MSRSFSSIAANAVSQWFGYDRNNLTPTWLAATDKFTQPGGSAEQKLGKIDSVTIRTREEGPVHKSHYDPTNKENCISARIKGKNDTKTCHIYEDGTGTTKKGDGRG